MRVVATSIGFDGVKLREIGEEFDLPDDVGPGDWFKPVDPPKAKRRKAAEADPEEPDPGTLV